MQFTIKLLIAICVIIFCSQIGKRVPTLSGLIATMPLTALIVMVWLNLEIRIKYCVPASMGLLS